jgi:hypothetical protein
MTYDDWKTHNPDDDRCELCIRGSVAGSWQPHCCTGQCERIWRDPDYEYEKMRDEPSDNPFENPDDNELAGN